MNYWLIGAAMLTMVTIVAHVYGGGREVHIPVLESELTVEVKALVSVVWHAVTAIMVLSAFWLGLAGFRGIGMGAVPYIAAQYLAFTGLFWLYGGLRMGSVFFFPQWYVFLTLAGLAGVGYWQGVRA